MKLAKIFFSVIIVCSQYVTNAQKQHSATRYSILMNMVHHNPGEPRFITKYNNPKYIKELGYNAQAPKIEIQCALTYDDWKKGIVPEKSQERSWIERHAARINRLIDIQKEAGLDVYPFTDVLVVPQSIINTFGKEMKRDGKMSIHQPRTQEILKAQIAEIFKRFPKIDGLTIRFGETYLHDTPFHQGTRPVYSPEDHVKFINILKDEVCVKRNKKLFYRTWDWGKVKRKFHLLPQVYLEITNKIEPHPNLYFSIKHVNGDFLRGNPFNKTIGIGEHQQIVEVSMNQAGMYGKNAHPYYIGQGVIEGWPEMEKKKGLRDLYNSPQVKGFYTWTWGDGWFGPYFDNEFWLDLNNYVIREFAKNPRTTEEQLFNTYASSVLKMQPKHIQKLRELCLLSIDAVFKGQSTSIARMRPWWIRDHFFSAEDMSGFIKEGVAKEVLAEKKENLKTWYNMEEIASGISLPIKEDEEFIKVSTTYGRIKYELIELIFRTQIMLAQIDNGKAFSPKEGKLILKSYSKKWDEWYKLKRENPNCPSLYVDYEAIHCQGNGPFSDSIKNLELLLEGNN